MAYGKMHKTRDWTETSAFFIALIIALKEVIWKSDTEEHVCLS